MFVKVKFKILDENNLKETTRVAVMPVDGEQPKHCFSEAICILENYWGFKLVDILSTSVLTDLDFLLLEQHFDIGEGDVE